MNYTMTECLFYLHALEGIKRRHRKKLIEAGITEEIKEEIIAQYKPGDEIIFDSGRKAILISNIEKGDFSVDNENKAYALLSVRYLDKDYINIDLDAFRYGTIRYDKSSKEIQFYTHRECIYLHGIRHKKKSCFDNVKMYI